MNNDFNPKLASEKLQPLLSKDEYVFCTFEHNLSGRCSELSPIAGVFEKEGLTLVILRKTADFYGFEYYSVFRKITLSVKTSLDAVGLTAEVSEKLACKNIPANIIAGFYHDHIFVPTEKASEAMEALSDPIRF